MMCQEVIELMQRYLDQDLDELEYEQMLGHLQQCPECTELFERLVALSQELEQLPKVTPAYSLVDAIMPKLQRIDEGFPAVEFPSASVVSVPDKYKEASASTQDAMTEVEHAAGWRKRMRGLISMRIVGGVVAAGLVLGFFVFEQQEQSGGMKNAESLLMSTASQSKAADTAKDIASSPSSKKEAQPAGSDINAVNPPADRKIAADSIKPDVAEKVPASAQQPSQEKKAPSGLDARQSVSPMDTPLRKNAEVRPAEPPSEPVQQQSVSDGGAVSDASPPSSQTVGPELKEAPVNENLGPPPVDPTVGQGGSAANKMGVTNTPQPPAKSDTAASDTAGGKASTFAPNQNEVSPGADPNGITADKADTGEMKGFNQMYTATSVESHVTLASQDKTYVASISDKRQVIIMDNQQKVLFTSSHTWTEKDKVELVEWTENKLLTYHVSNASGTTTYVINVKDKTESKK